jgi:hypothetical protein
MALRGRERAGRAWVWAPGTRGVERRRKGGRAHNGQDPRAAAARRRYLPCLDPKRTLRPENSPTFACPPRLHTNTAFAHPQLVHLSRSPVYASFSPHGISHIKTRHDSDNPSIGPDVAADSDVRQRSSSRSCLPCLVFNLHQTNTVHSLSAAETWSHKSLSHKSLNDNLFQKQYTFIKGSTCSDSFSDISPTPRVLLAETALVSLTHSSCLVAELAHARSLRNARARCVLIGATCPTFGLYLWSAPHCVRSTAHFVHNLPFHAASSWNFLPDHGA